MSASYCYCNPRSWKMDRWVLLKGSLSPGCCGSTWLSPVPHSSFISLFGFQRGPQSKTQKYLCGSSSLLQPGLRVQLSWAWWGWKWSSEKLMSFLSVQRGQMFRMCFAELLISAVAGTNARAPLPVTLLQCRAQTLWCCLLSIGLGQR